MTKIKSIQMDDLPDLLEELNGIFKREIDRWKAQESLTINETYVAIGMYNRLMNAYIQYRMLKVEIMSEMKLSNTPINKADIEARMKAIIANSN